MAALGGLGTTYLSDPSPEDETFLATVDYVLSAELVAGARAVAVTA